MGFRCENFFELQNVLNIPHRFELISEDLLAKSTSHCEGVYAEIRRRLSLITSFTYSDTVIHRQRIDPSQLFLLERHPSTTETFRGVPSVTAPSPSSLHPA